MKTCQLAPYTSGPHGLHPSCERSHLCQGDAVDLYPNSFAKKCVEKNVKNKPVLTDSLLPFLRD